MKIVVVGLGKVGRALTQQLSADKHDIVVISHRFMFCSIFRLLCIQNGTASFKKRGAAFDLFKATPHNSRLAA